jgi:predicted nucleotidyltransferase
MEYEPLPLFRSPAQARLLAHLYVAADRDPESLSALSKRLAIPLSSVQREIDALERAGLVSSERVGATRLVSANRDSPFFDDLERLLVKAFGPTTVLSNVLRRVPGIHDAFVYGSWARRYLGDATAAPRDIDVAVITPGDANPVYAATRRAETELDIEINPIVITPSEWDSPSGLVERIKHGPLLRLELDDAAA